MDKGVIVMICAIVVFIMYLVWFARHCMKQIKDQTYVHKKTGNKYFFLDYVKSKNPSTREWYEAVRYYSTKNSEYYVREKESFFNEFVKLKDWKDGH